MRILTIPAAAVLLAACSTTTYYGRADWAEPADRGQFAQDKAECMAMAGPSPAYDVPDSGNDSASGAGGMASGMQSGMQWAQIGNARQRQEAIFQNCMIGRGWTPQ